MSLLLDALRRAEEARRAKEASTNAPQADSIHVAPEPVHKHPPPASPSSELATKTCLIFLMRSTPLSKRRRYQRVTRCEHGEMRVSTFAIVSASCDPMESKVESLSSCCWQFS